jgi:hypothetical protein
LAPAVPTSTAVRRAYPLGGVLEATLTWLATCLVVLCAVAACDGADGRRGGRAGLEARIVGELPFARRAEGRPAAQDVIAAEVRWQEASTGRQGAGVEVERRVEHTIAELRELPAHERHAHLRLLALDGLLDAIWVTAEQLAYRRLAIEHPEIVATLAPGDDDLRKLQRVPALEAVEIDRRAAALEHELDEVLARYADVVTSYVECTRHLSDEIKTVRAMIASARGELTVTTGPVLWLLRRAAPHIATQPAIPADLGQPYPWPSCEQYRR